MRFEDLKLRNNSGLKFYENASGESAEMRMTGPSRRNGPSGSENRSKVQATSADQVRFPYKNIRPTSLKSWVNIVFNSCRSYPHEKGKEETKYSSEVTSPKTIMRGKTSDE